MSPPNHHTHVSHVTLFLFSADFFLLTFLGVTTHTAEKSSNHVRPYRFSVSRVIGRKSPLVSPGHRRLLATRSAASRRPRSKVVFAFWRSVHTDLSTLQCVAHHSATTTARALHACARAPQQLRCRRRQALYLALRRKAIAACQNK